MAISEIMHGHYHRDVHCVLGPFALHRVKYLYLLRYQKFGYAYIDYTPVAEEGFLIVVSLRALVTHRAPKANIILWQCRHDEYQIYLIPTLGHEKELTFPLGYFERYYNILIKIVSLS